MSLYFLLQTIRVFLQITRIVLGGFFYGVDAQSARNISTRTPNADGPNPGRRGLIPQDKMLSNVKQFAVHFFYI